MENKNSTLIKILMLLKKFDKACEAILNLAKSLSSNTEKIKEKLTDLVLKISLLLGRFLKDLVNLKYLLILLNSHKLSFNKLLLVLNDKILNNADTTKLLKILLNSLGTLLYKLRKLLSENIGQTNQCYILLDKLCKKLEQLNPLTVNNSSLHISLPLLILKKIKKILLRAVLGIIIPIIMYVLYIFGSLVYNNIIDSEYKKIHSNLVEIIKDKNNK